MFSNMNFFFRYVITNDSITLTILSDTKAFAEPVTATQAHQGHGLLMFRAGLTWRRRETFLLPTGTEPGNPTRS
jgi:hypothetical protein